MKKFIITNFSLLLFVASPLFVLAYGETINPCPGTLSKVCSTSFNFSTLVSNVLSYLFVFAAIMALIFLIWGGIKWITSGGDKAKVEGARSTIIGSIIGLIVVFASYLIINLVLSSLFGIQLNQLSLPSLSGSGGTGSDAACKNGQLVNAPPGCNCASGIVTSAGRCTL